jgi:hypothetical protein
LQIDFGSTDFGSYQKRSKKYLKLLVLGHIGLRKKSTATDFVNTVIFQTVEGLIL